MRWAFAVATLGLVASDMLPPPNYFEMWKNFTQKYGKMYENQVEEERFRVFRANVDSIYAENAKGNSYELGVTEYADLTADEFWSTHGDSLGSRPKLGLHAQGGFSNLTIHGYNGESLASSVDWSKHHVVTPVKTQHGPDCWSFSITGALEGAILISGDRRRRGKALTWTGLSEQQLVDCMKGTWNAGSYSYAKAHGMCTQESYKETGPKGTCKASNCLAHHLALPRYEVQSWVMVQSMSEGALMSAIQRTPVSVSLNGASSIFQHYTKGVLTKAGCTGGTSGHSHAVLAVGYGTSGGKKYWKLKNSWGAGWGEHGYIRLLRGRGGSGECGILDGQGGQGTGSNSYPIVSRRRRRRRSRSGKLEEKQEELQEEEHQEEEGMMLV